LLTIDGDPARDEVFVDLAHEVMIRAWPTLAGWSQSLRIDEQRRRDIEAAARAWIRHGRGAGGLLDAVELAELRAWRQTEIARELGESADVVAFIAASEAALLASKASARARRRTPSHAMVTSGHRRAGCGPRSCPSPRGSQHR
jgi:hypothetical protein